MRQIRFIFTAVIILLLFSKCKKTTSKNYFGSGNIDSILILTDSLAKSDYNQFLKYNNQLLILAYKSREAESFEKVIAHFSICSTKVGRESDLIISLNRLLEDIEQPFYTGWIFGYMGEVYYNLGDFETTLYYDLKALEAAIKLGDPRRIAFMQNRIGDDYLVEGNLKDADYFFDQSYQTAIKLNDSKLIATTTSNKGHVLMVKRRFEESLIMLNNSKRLSERIRDLPGVAYCNFYNALCYFEKGNFELANIYFDSVCNSYAYFLEPRDKLELFLKKAKTEFRLGKTNSAYFFLDRHLSLKDSLQVIKKTKALQKITIDRYHKELTDRKNLQYITFASILIIALAILLMAFIYSIKAKRIQQRSFEEMNQLKSKFFDNISHEFRTPITLIIGPLTELYSKASNDEKTLIGTMMRSGQRLLRLVSQLLDLSKLEAGKMQLHAAAIDLVEFLRESTSSYESLASDKKIRFLFQPDVQDLIVYFDPEKMEKVVQNILSNAFKFTKDGGEVVLYLRVQKERAVIVVKDTGIGIPMDQLGKVFDRFYQVDNSRTRSYEGSGLGMALAKELIELHRGKISVESIEGGGATFTVSLPLGKEHLNDDEIIGIESLNRENYSHGILIDEKDVDVFNSADEGESSQQSVLLVVEDNADMRFYIQKSLAGYYQVLEAANGIEGVNMAEAMVPDLIISDIMMPELDGYRLCEIIKSSELTSHIPIILLTAKADRESKLSGLRIGADDYLSKPFDAEELRLIVRNRIEQRKMMRERFSREITLEPRQISITSLDERFITKVLAIIEDHMDDEMFSIDELSREAGYSNIHFYRKIKALAGQTPNQFLRTIRLKRAAELLSRRSDNVAQIAYSVGFVNLSYFSKRFKEQFGMTPGQFAEQHAKAPSTAGTNHES